MELGRKVCVGHKSEKSVRVLKCANVKMSYLRVCECQKWGEKSMSM